MEFRLGLENLMREPPSGNIALVTNSSGVTRDLVQNVDLFINKGLKLKMIFAPEHGFFAALRNGEDVPDENYSGIPVRSIYSQESKGISAKDLEDVDTVIFDIQDGGTRPYTYLSSLKHILSSVSKAGKQIVVCDRPAPLDASTVDGPMMMKGFTSFVGIDYFPLRYGLTVGEMAIFLNRDINADLRISKMTGYGRSGFYHNYMSYYVPPSLNLPSLDSLFVFNGMVLTESAEVSVGRGTPYPFTEFGYHGAWDLDLRKEIGAIFRRTMFVPYLDPLKDRMLQGYFIHIQDRKRFNSIILAIKVIKHLYRTRQEAINFRHLSILYGSDSIKKHLDNDSSIDEIKESWSSEYGDYLEIRKNLLLYQ